MTMVGADADALDAAAAELEAAAHELRGSTTGLGGLLNGVSWIGQVASAFVGQWNSDFRPRVGSTADFVDDAARRLRQQAAQQRAASQSNGALAWTPPPGWHAAPGSGHAPSGSNDELWTLIDSFFDGIGGLLSIGGLGAGSAFSKIGGVSLATGGLATGLSIFSTMVDGGWRTALEGGGMALDAGSGILNVLDLQRARALGLPVAPAGAVALLGGALIAGTSAVDSARAWTRLGETNAFVDSADFVGSGISAVGGVIMATTPVLGPGAFAIGATAVAGGQIVKATGWAWEHRDEIGSFVSSSAGTVGEAVVDVGDAVGDAVGAAVSAPGKLLRKLF